MRTNNITDEGMRESRDEKIQNYEHNLNKTDKPKHLFKTMELVQI